ITKILLPPQCQPYPTQFENDSLTDVASQRLCKGQDIFTLRGHVHCYGLHLIAQNISQPSMLLEYPSWDYFEKEVRKGYDFVGISFYQPCTDIVLDMCKIIRRVAPETKIVLGHYGALTFNAAFPEDYKKEHADYVCIGEGIKFFRTLLGEPLDSPISQSYLPRCGDNLPWLDRHPGGNNSFVIAGLGCPSGCDFCATTEMHANERIMLYPPDKVFEEIKRIYRSFPNTVQVTVYDEDFLKYTEEVRELGRLVQEDSEFGLRKINWFALSSIESLNQYDWDELALTGFGGTFIGIESKFAPTSGYQKRTGDAKETIEELQKRGITCLGGLMLGFDFHDRINIHEDINYYISLGLVSHQISRVSPLPGTPLWYRLKEENRLFDIPWEDQNFYGGGMKYRNFEPHEVEALVLESLKKYYQTWGPSLMRQFRIELNGYEYCRASSHRLLREERAERHRGACYQLYPTVKACEYFAPNGIVRRKIRQLAERYTKNFGTPAPSQEIMSYYVLLKAFQAKIREGIDPINRHPKQEPFKIYRYDKNNGQSEPPYKVLYPNKDYGYEFYRDWRGIKEQGFTKVLDYIDKILAPDKAAKTTTSMDVRCR